MVDLDRLGRQPELDNLRRHILLLVASAEFLAWLRRFIRDADRTYVFVPLRLQNFSLRWQLGLFLLVIRLTVARVIAFLIPVAAFESELAILSPGHKLLLLLMLFVGSVDNEV